MTTPAAPRAVLFDIDGTLVDSNYLHVEAWTRTFADLEVAVDAWTVHRSIGLDSARMLDALLGDRVEELGDAVKTRHSEVYEELVPRLRAFDDARELIAHLNDAGVKVVLATSAPGEEFENLRACLDLDDAHYTATTAEDVETAKPEPDVIYAALELAGTPAEETVMIGDARWDAEAAGRAGVRSIGVLTGGISEGELRDAGATAVFRDVAEILAAVRRDGLDALAATP